MIYLDHQATTPVDTRVLAQMLPYFNEHFGNASSRSHAAGWRAQEAVEHSRTQVASLIGALPDSVVWTSGATEALSLGIHGQLQRFDSPHVITQATEHPAVLGALKLAQSRGAHVSVISTDGLGRVDPEDIRNSLRPETKLVVIMHANNEVGTLQPIKEIARICNDANVPLLVDAAQGLACTTLDVDDAGISMLSLSAHKLYGPKGVGALYVRRGRSGPRLIAQTPGGGQERRLRGGTLNVPGIVGMGEACAIARVSRDDEAERLVLLGTKMKEELSDLRGLRFWGHANLRVPGTLYLTLAGVDAELVLLGLKESALSSAAACASSSQEPSHVLRAIGVPEELLGSGFRMSFGRFTTEEELVIAADDFRRAVKEAS